MPTLAQSPSMLVYSITMIVLCVNLLVLWGYSGTVRSRSKTTPNAEDPETIVKGAAVTAADPPDVARALRAHTNAAANIVPFAILGFLYVVYGASTLSMAIVCGVFVVARIGHTVVYLRAIQPWRTILYAIGGVDTFVLTVLLVRAMANAMG
jgi:microsomal prostaglandin-E synthase 1